MSKPSRTEPGRALLALAKRQSELAIDLRMALAWAEGRQWADSLLERARALQRDIEWAAVDVQLGRRELGPGGAEMPILAAIEAKAGPAVREPVPVVAAPADKPADPAWDVFHTLAHGPEAWVCRVWTAKKSDAYQEAMNAFDQAKFEDKFDVREAAPEYDQVVRKVGGERLVRTDWGVARMATAEPICRTTPTDLDPEPAAPADPLAIIPGNIPAHVIPPDFDFCSLHPPAKPKEERPRRVRRPKAAATPTIVQAPPDDDDPAFVCNRCNHARRPESGHPCPECKCPEFRLRNFPEGELTEYEKKLFEGRRVVVSTFEVVESPSQKTPGHVQFRALDLPSAVEKARVDWPGLHVRPVPPDRDLANARGSDGRPKTLPGTIAALAPAPTPPPAAPGKFHAWEIQVEREDGSLHRSVRVAKSEGDAKAIGRRIKGANRVKVISGWSKADYDRVYGATRAHR